MTTQSILTDFAAARDFDMARDFYRQEIPKILHFVARNPDASLRDLTHEHLRLRGLKPFENDFRIEHDFAHVFTGLDFHLRVMNDPPEQRDYPDFQSSMYTEFFAINTEHQFRPPGATYAEPTIFIPEYIKSIQDEQNLKDTMSWLIGRQTGDRPSNIQYMYGESLDPFITQLEKRGYKVDARREDHPYGAWEWSIFNHEGKRLYGNASPQGEEILPTGHNGIKKFTPFIFMDEARFRTYYDMVQPNIDFVLEEARKRGKTVGHALAHIRAIELIEHMTGKPFAETMRQDIDYSL